MDNEGFSALFGAHCSDISTQPPVLSDLIHNLDQQEPVSIMLDSFIDMEGLALC